MYEPSVSRAEEVSGIARLAVVIGNVPPHAEIGVLDTVGAGSSDIAKFISGSRNATGRAIGARGG
jgi:hypothetical protein